MPELNRARKSKGTSLQRQQKGCSKIKEIAIRTKGKRISRHDSAPTCTCRANSRSDQKRIEQTEP